MRINLGSPHLEAAVRAGQRGGSSTASPFAMAFEARAFDGYAFERHAFKRRAVEERAFLGRVLRGADWLGWRHAAVLSV